jgi:enamine deaminase RidA (YjgF/YER057c/UK114 family)
MSAVKFSQTNDLVGAVCQKTGFSQAVSIPATSRTVITAGQAGFDLKTGILVETSVEEQISAAFDCMDAALRSGGVKDGLASVHKMVRILVIYFPAEYLANCGAVTTFCFEKYLKATAISRTSL